MNYITVRGFTLRHAATPWAPPTAEQIGLIGTHWSKGWIIEDNTISHSKCVGVALGKYGDQWDNTSANTAEGYVLTINRALENGWSGENIGHHIVRNNHISHCEQAGVVGFCMGGGLALMTALADAGVGNVGAVAPFYGQPLSPEQAAQVQAPVLGLYGADDGGIPVSAVQAMQDALTAADVANEFQIYAGAPHAFFNDTRDSYRPEAAADAWARLLTWFGEYL